MGGTANSLELTTDAEITQITVGQAVRFTATYTNTGGTILDVNNIGPQSVLFLLLVVLAIDGVIIAKRRITRAGGRSFAHIAFLGMILTILLIAKAGEILRRIIV